MQKLTPRGVPCLQVDCSVGRGNNYIEHGGYPWRTLAGADPQGPWNRAPNDGCQRGPWTGSEFSPANYLPLPAGWVLAPNDATSVAVVAAHGWSTSSMVLADGVACYTSNSSSHSPGTCPFTGPHSLLATSGDGGAHFSAARFDADLRSVACQASVLRSCRALYI